MSRPAKGEYFRLMYQRYQRASPAHRARLLDEICTTCGYNRKYAIRKLNGPRPPTKVPPPRHRARRQTYRPAMLAILREVWAAAGYPWSVRLKALLPLWLPWIQKHFRLTRELEQQLLAISPRQMDRRRHPSKRQLRKRLYGRTKPGTLLKHQIPIRTEHWAVTTPGFVEIDRVPHSGHSGDGEFIHTCPSSQ